MFKTACKVPVNSQFISKAAEVRKLGGGRWGWWSGSRRSKGISDGSSIVRSI